MAKEDRRRSHKNTSRLTAKERAELAIQAFERSDQAIARLGPIVERAIQAAVRQALARKARRR